jgi:hypothetical protein
MSPMVVGLSLTCWMARHRPVGYQREAAFALASRGAQVAEQTPRWAGWIDVAKRRGYAGRVGTSRERPHAVQKHPHY